jgi:hypothetical protein
VTPHQPWYSDLLYRSAAKWDLPVPEDRPYIDDDSSPYPKLHIVEVLRWEGDKPWRYAEIQLVTLNGLWAYAGGFEQSQQGSHFPALLKFCQPLPTREAALLAAITWIQRTPNLDPDLATWLKTLCPLQLTLF